MAKSGCSAALYDVRMLRCRKKFRNRRKKSNRISDHVNIFCVVSSCCQWSLLPDWIGAYWPAYNNLNKPGHYTGGAITAEVTLASLKKKTQTCPCFNFVTSWQMGFRLMFKTVILDRFAVILSLSWSLTSACLKSENLAIYYRSESLVGVYLPAQIAVTDNQRPTEITWQPISHNLAKFNFFRPADTSAWGLLSPCFKHQKRE